MTGIDFCPELIEAARETAASQGRDIQFELGDMLRMPFRDDQFQLIVSNHSVNEVDDVSLLFREFARVLKKRAGRLVILMLHPCFSGWVSNDDSEYGPDRVGRKAYEVAGACSPKVATAHVTTLERYIEALCAAELGITGFKELRPTRTQVEGESRCATQASSPRFLLIEAMN